LMDRVEEARSIYQDLQKTVQKEALLRSPTGAN
jgi:hypothetical protein